MKTRSASATRPTKSSTTGAAASESTSSYESRSKTLERPTKAQRAAKAEAMSKVRSYPISSLLCLECMNSAIILHYAYTRSAAR